MIERQWVRDVVRVKNWHWIHSIWSNDQRLLCLNPINIKTTVHTNAGKQKKHASIKALIIHFSHWFHCMSLLQKRRGQAKNYINWFYILFSCFYFPFYSWWSRNPEREEVAILLKIRIIRFTKWHHVFYWSFTSFNRVQQKSQANDETTTHFAKWNAALYRTKIAWLKSVITLNVTHIHSTPYEKGKNTFNRHKWWRRRQWLNRVQHRKKLCWINYLFGTLVVVLIQCVISVAFNWVSLWKLEAILRHYTISLWVDSNTKYANRKKPQNNHPFTLFFT